MAKAWGGRYCTATEMMTDLGKYATLLKVMFLNIPK
jgi:hypothetical protein